MTEFDPTKHMLVGVIPATGEHVHVEAKNIEAGVASRIEDLESTVTELTAQLAQSNAQLLDICRALDDRISSFGLKVEKAA